MNSPLRTLYLNGIMMSQNRHPTKAAIEKIATYFQLPNQPVMQDWEYEVADPTRLDEFLSALYSEIFNDDERYVLAHMIIQSFEDSELVLQNNEKWHHFIAYMEENIHSYGSTIEYWSAVDSESADSWRVTPFMRQISREKISKLSRKQKIYRAIIRSAHIETRNTMRALYYSNFLTRLLPTYKKRVDSIYHLSEAIHNMHLCMFDPEYGNEDLWMINHQFKYLWEQYDKIQLGSRDVIGYYTLRIIEDLPDHLQRELTWNGPKAEEINWKPHPVNDEEYEPR